MLWPSQWTPVCYSCIWYCTLERAQKARDYWKKAQGVDGCLLRQWNTGLFIQAVKYGFKYNTPSIFSGPNLSHLESTVSILNVTSQTAHYIKLNLMASRQTLLSFQHFLYAPYSPVDPYSQASSFSTSPHGPHLDPIPGEILRKGGVLEKKGRIVKFNWERDLRLMAVQWSESNENKKIKRGFGNVRQTKSWLCQTGFVKPLPVKHKFLAGSKSASLVDLLRCKSFFKDCATSSGI